MANSITTEKIRTLLSKLNPTVDTTDPVVKDLFINFGANIVENVDSRVTALSSRYTTNFLSNLSDTELAAYAYTTKGKTRKSGTAATGFVYLMISNYDMTQDLPIPVNTLFSTSDGVWQYYSTKTIKILSEDLSRYYNPIKGLLEVRIPIQAVDVGVGYRAAAYRINTLKSTLNFNASVENREAITDGTDPESREDFQKRVEFSLSGYDINSKASTRENILSQFPAITDIDIIHSSQDSNTFEVYFIGTAPMTDSFSTVLKSRKISMPTERIPIRFIEFVAVDGVEIDRSKYGYSTSTVVLDPVVTFSSGTSIAVVSYQYNDLASQLKDYLAATIDIADSKWIAKEATEFPLTVNVRIKPASFLTIESIQDSVVNALLEILNPEVFVSSISAAEIEAALKQSTNNLVDVKLTLNGSSYITLNKGQYPTLLLENITVDAL